MGGKIAKSKGVPFFAHAQQLVTKRAPANRFLICWFSNWLAPNTKAAAGGLTVTWGREWGIPAHFFAKKV
jgi:hypothetical protein